MNKPADKDNQPLALFWFRRDLRLHDNAGLYHALRSGLPVVPVFIFDRLILDELESRTDARVEYIYQAIQDLQKELVAMGSSLHVVYGTPRQAFAQLFQTYHVKAIYTNRDYEQYAKTRDADIAQLAAAGGASFQSYKDQAIFDHDEVLTQAGKPYSVFTPYSRTWHERLNEFYLKTYPCQKYYSAFFRQAPLPIPTLEEMGFQHVAIDFPPRTVSDDLIRTYGQRRNFPAIDGTSRLSVHLRFGTISVRELARQAQAAGGATYFNEICWRDFYFQVLDHFPHVEQHNFRREFDRLQWRNNPDEFEAWCQGRTGYAIVDAGMRQLNATGWMHNRLRMITASFLCKHLLVDWRWGERYFAARLIDYDLSANNGGWQWAASTGTDAQPYFRIFSPSEQLRKYDPKLEFVRQWVPEVDSLAYQPIVDHAFARDRALQVYGAVRQDR